MARKEETTIQRAAHQKVTALIRKVIIVVGTVRTLCTQAPTVILLRTETKGGLQGTNWSFSNKLFCKEINLLAKKSSKKKVLDFYATAIKCEQAKLSKCKPK